MDAALTYSVSGRGCVILARSLALLGAKRRAVSYHFGSLEGTV